MTSLLIVLASIALLDSTSIVPICIVPLSTILGGPRPVLRAAALLLGVFVAYTACGLLILLGLDALFDSLAPALSHWWSNPDTLDVVLQLAIALTLVLIALSMSRTKQTLRSDEASGSMSVGRCLGLGATLTILGMPGAVPYFGAIDQVLRADLLLAGNVLVILFYNVVFLLPLLSVVLVRIVAPSRSVRIFGSIQAFTVRWGRRLIIGAFFLLGIVLLVDGIGWFIGYPVLPIA